MTNPRFSVVEYTTPKLSFAEDVALYSDLEADGIGIDELKLDDDREALQHLADGTFGNDFPDSLWKIDPRELVAAGRDRFLHLWETRAIDPA